MLTVDVEDYFQVSAFEHQIQRKDWHKMPCRVEPNTEKLLSLFNECGVSATFFVLGWVARKFPQLIQRIADSGHEIASHGYWHQLVYKLSPDEFRKDLQDSRNAIEEACGVRVTAYRAPSFSIVKDSLWALDVLTEEGFDVDSSIFPIRHDRYGMPDANPEIHLRQTKHGQIVELPPSIWQTPVTKVPIGGGYFRLFPLRVTDAAIRNVRALGRPAMFYIHPWEIDPQQPRVPSVGWKSRFRHYVGLDRTEQKLRKLLLNNPFDSVRNVLAKHDAIAT